MLRSIDLFSGCGGLTHAFAGVARPLLYCDADEDAQRVLHARQADGALPRARIHGDIRSLRVRRGGADLVVGGFPCVGFSARGLHRSFEDEQSGLFHHLVRVVRESGAGAVFMENVPAVVHETGTIAPIFRRMGFAMRWTIVGADDVGAPHGRKRWFALAYKPSSRLLQRRWAITGKGYQAYDWSSTAEPKRTSKVADGDMRAVDARWAMLGNGVVPDAARLAFFRMLTAGAVDRLAPGTVKFLHGTESTRPGDAARSDVLESDLEGRVIRFVSSRIAAPKTRYKKLRFDPTLIPPPPVPCVNQSTPTLTEPLTLRKWATPRHTMLRSCRVLTERSCRDLPTQIAFEIRTRNRTALANPEWGEWLMGLPLGFTAPIRQ